MESPREGQSIIINIVLHHLVVHKDPMALTAKIDVLL